jgi:hypothetical protein
LIFWGLGIGDWGLGIGDWGLGPIPNHNLIILLINLKFMTYKNTYFNILYK